MRNNISSNRKVNPNTWKSLFLPLTDTEQAVFATTFARSQKVAVVKKDGSLCIYGLDVSSKGPHVVKNHVPTQARANLCPDTAEAVVACSWSQPRQSFGVAKSSKDTHPTEECLHGAVGFDSGHVLLFDSIGGFHGGFCATQGVLETFDTKHSGGDDSNNNSQAGQQGGKASLKKGEGIVAVECVLGWYDSVQCEQTFNQQMQGVANNYHRQGNSSFGEKQDFDSALGNVAVTSGNRSSAYTGRRSSFASSMETIDPTNVGGALNGSAEEYSPRAALTPSTSPTLDTYGTTTGGTAVSKGVTGLVVATSGGSIVVCRRRHPWGIFERCQMLVQSSFFSSAGAFATSDEAIFHCGRGKDSKIHVVHLSQRILEKPIELPAAFTKTTALAADGHVCCAARNGIIYTIHYGRLLVTKLLSLEEEVHTLNLRRPLLVAGTKSGRIAVICIDDGKLLSSTYTYNYTRPVAVTVDWSMLSLLVVDESAAVELLAFPESVRRYAPEERFECNQARVLQRLIHYEEDNKEVRGCDNVEALVLARFCVPEECETYLSRRTILP